MIFPKVVDINDFSGHRKSKLSQILDKILLINQPLFVWNQFYFIRFRCETRKPVASKLATNIENFHIEGFSLRKYRLENFQQSLHRYHAMSKNFSEY